MQKRTSFVGAVNIQQCVQTNPILNLHKLGDQSLSTRDCESCRFSKPWQVSEKELEWDRTTCRPCILVVLGLGEREVEELGARPVAFPYQTISHAARRFVVVARPTAVEINPKFSL